MTSPRFLSFRVAAITVAGLLCVCAAAYGSAAPFDLNGPKIDVTVTRDGKTLPITEVPNLAVGDKLWIHPDFPEDQEVHYLLVAAFLRGVTNVPPEKWFYKAETWKDKFKHKGMTITVPKGAQQVLLFLAPETGGDFKTLMGAVRGQPGAFVRASQDLNQASLDRSRLDKYLVAVRRISETDPEQLKTVSPLLARSLDIRLKPDCLNREMIEIAPCLTQEQSNLVLNDGHSQSIVGALTSGPSADLAMQASYTPQLNYGYYGSYVASAMDIVRILDSLHTAQYQYIPALAEMKNKALELKLNTPPSFHNPKSVLVIGLPAVEGAQPPPLRPVDEDQVYCAQNATLALPVEGAPLVFSTGYARNLMLHLQAANGKSVNLPLTPDAVRGGLDVDTKPLQGAVIGSDVKASIRGYWGFEPFTGPAVRLQGAHAQTWKIADEGDNSLVVGRDDTLTLEADDASCVDGIEYRNAAGKALKANWKLVKPNQVEVTLPLKDAQPGQMTLMVKQAGVDKPEDVAVQAYSEQGHLTSFTLYAGDKQGMLEGTRLDEVASVKLKGVEFKPGTLTSTKGMDTLPMVAANEKDTGKLKAGESFKAVAMLKDGRKETVRGTIGDARPSVTLLSKSVQMNGSGANEEATSNIQLSDPDELPQNATLLFSLKAQTPSRFMRGEKIEVATADGSYTTTLTLAKGLTLQDSHTALATFDPSEVFGSSAFGPLKFRVVTDVGVKGDWQPLATLVRLPKLASLKCSADDTATCKLQGSDLFLVDAIAQDQEFKNAVQVPDGFSGWTLPVPHPGLKGQLYVKLRDDPSAVNLVTLTPQIEGGAKQATQKEYRPPYVGPNDGTGAAVPAATGTTAPAAGVGVTSVPAVGSTAGPVAPAVSSSPSSAAAAGSTQAVPNATTPKEPTTPTVSPSVTSPNAATATTTTGKTSTPKTGATSASTTKTGTTSGTPTAPGNATQEKTQKKTSGKSAEAVLQPVDPGNFI
ncbi:MAG TPA: hypothetical protein VMU92_01670 [Acidobacteriaceae bacterium]|nr:hypothetical protein [Acidobacteriaceae bacterium]